MKWVNEMRKDRTLHVLPFAMIAVMLGCSPIEAATADGEAKGIERIWWRGRSDRSDQTSSDLETDYSIFGKEFGVTLVRTGGNDWRIFPWLEINSIKYYLSRDLKGVVYEATSTNVNVRSEPAEVEGNVLRQCSLAKGELVTLVEGQEKKAGYLLVNVIKKPDTRTSGERSICGIDKSLYVSPLVVAVAHGYAAERFLKKFQGWVLSDYNKEKNFGPIAKIVGLEASGEILHINLTGHSIDVQNTGELTVGTTKVATTDDLLTLLKKGLEGWIRDSLEMKGNVAVTFYDNKPLRDEPVNHLTHQITVKVPWNTSIFSSTITVKGCGGLIFSGDGQGYEATCSGPARGNYVLAVTGDVEGTATLSAPETGKPLNVPDGNFRKSFRIKMPSPGLLPPSYRFDVGGVTQKPVQKRANEWQVRFSNDDLEQNLRVALDGPHIQVCTTTNPHPKISGNLIILPPEAIACARMGTKIGSWWEVSLDARSCPRPIGGSACPLNYPAPETLPGWQTSDLKLVDLLAEKPPHLLRPKWSGIFDSGADNCDRSPAQSSYVLIEYCSDSDCSNKVTVATPLMQLPTLGEVNWQQPHLPNRYRISGPTGPVLTESAIPAPVQQTTDFRFDPGQFHNNAKVVAYGTEVDCRLSTRELWSAALAQAELAGKRLSSCGYAKVRVGDVDESFCTKPKSTAGGTVIELQPRKYSDDRFVVVIDNHLQGRETDNLKQPIESWLKGLHAANRQGRKIPLSLVRANSDGSLTPILDGEDLETIDWKATGNDDSVIARLKRILFNSDARLNPMEILRESDRLWRSRLKRLLFIVNSPLPDERLRADSGLILQWTLDKVPISVITTLGNCAGWREYGADNCHGPEDLTQRLSTFTNNATLP